MLAHSADDAYEVLREASDGPQEEFVERSAYRTFLLLMRCHGDYEEGRIMSIPTSSGLHASHKIPPLWSKYNTCSKTHCWVAAIKHNVLARGGGSHDISLVIHKPF